MESITLTLGGSDYQVSRFRLGGFLDLQIARRFLQEAVESGDNGSIANCIFNILVLAMPDFPRELFDTLSWIEILEAYKEIVNINIIPGFQDFAILLWKERGDDLPWAYPSREKIIWIHLIASAYGWEKDSILDLYPEEAVPLLMEILADRHADREFSYRLSTIAYTYDKGTKKSRYVELPKPIWMLGGVKVKREDKIIQALPKGMLPVGEVHYPEDAEERLKPHK